MMVLLANYHANLRPARTRSNGARGKWATDGNGWNGLIHCGRGGGFAFAQLINEGKKKDQIELWECELINVFVLVHSFMNVLKDRMAAEKWIFAVGHRII